MGNAIGEGSYAEMIVNNGDVSCAATYFYVGDTGPATFTMNGGTFTMTHSSGIMNIGHQKTGRDVGTIILNGGALAVRKLRLDYSQPGSKIVFNGGTLKPITGASDFIDAAGNAANVTCEVQAGGMVIDTAGYNVTIKHDLVLAEGVTSAPLIKKGAGTLTLSGSTPFAEESIFVYEGTASVGGVAYGVNIGDITDASAGGDLGEVVIHGEKLESWLKDPDFTTYTSKYGAAGTNSLENPLTITMSVNGALKRYSNLETGKTYNDTVNNVSYSFTTENLPPRTMQVVAPNGSLIKNVRDVGSWPLVSVDGSAKMNQGVIFRGATLDAFVNATAAQKAASALADLKTEIDLRATSEIAAGYLNVAKSWAAVDADYLNLPISSGSQISADDNGVFTNQVRRMFSRLGTQGALPAYFHCAIGTDRTGITGLLLLGLMGVEEEVLYRDYLTSNFANIGSSRTPGVPEKFILYLLRGDCNSNKYVYRENAYGATVAGRARAYLEMCGVTAAEIANITQALSGETPAEVLARVDAYEAANNVRTVNYVPYPGANSTNAAHRLPAGTHILPMSAPARTGFVFAGWDTEHEADGIVYALWEPLVPHHWVGPSGASESFFSAAAWDPALDDGVFEPDDVLVLNRGNDKVALLSEGSASVQTLYVGWGSNDGGKTISTSNDHGGRLDMTGGTLNVTNLLYIGGYRSVYSNIVNVAGGSLVAHTLYMGDYYDSKKNGKCDVLNISGNGAVENTTGEFQMSIRSGGASTRLNITDNGSFTSLQNVKLSTVASGKAAIAIDGNGSMTIASGKSIYIGHGSGGLGEISLDGSATFSGVYDVVMGYVAGSTGRVHVAGNSNLSASHYIYVGRLGSGEMTIDGGHVTGMSTTYFGFTGASGNSAVLNLNGGKLTTRSLTVAGSPNAVFNWNGGTLECSTYSYAEGNMIPANANLQVNVLAGGAVYNAVVRDDEEIKHDLSGVGSLTKKGDKPLTVSGAVDLQGGFIVEGGTLTLSNVTGTEFRRISVAEGAALDLNGAEVTVGSYVLNGVSKPNGTYSEQNGTIHVKTPPMMLIVR
jgi:protein-tyrosine phosphatase